MADQLFMFLALGVAEQSTDYRPGARHALMIFVTASSLQAARLQAVEFVSRRGWCAVDLRREKSIGVDASGISDDILKAAAETAMQSDGAVIVYAEEVPADS
ncbi:hypothetical protein [Phenylobacterium sp.]|uniref:hypothetical protein n=1 Tax=Phenylobacterium sp. TaxID=1871053 RepID=UPI002FC606F8